MVASNRQASPRTGETLGEINTEDHAMSWDDDLPRPKATITVGDKLHQLSLEELDDRIAALEAEMLRVTTERKAKKALVSAAAALFKD
jgi:uncharacterized small protein (DUF1192 family)